jgi:hypothetical protein
MITIDEIHPSIFPIDSPSGLTNRERIINRNSKLMLRIDIYIYMCVNMCIFISHSVRHIVLFVIVNPDIIP